MGIILWLVFFSLASAYIVDVHVGDVDCYTEYVSKGNKVVGSWVLIQEEAGLQVEVSIVDTSGAIYESAENDLDDSFAFMRNYDGNVDICFTNKGGGVARLAFHLYTGEELTHHELPKAHHLSPLEFSISLFAEGLASVADEIGYIKVREEVHRDTNESTNFRVLIGSVVQSVLLFTVAIWQIVAIRHFFETKRGV